MRFRKNYLWVAVAILVIAGGIFTALMLRRRAAPDAVRLLPDSDAVLYVNLEPIRLLTDLGKNPPQDRDPKYEEFVQQTGFEFERDLDKAAFAIQYGTAANGKEKETRYSEILQGHFDSTRVGNYLRHLAANTEPYEGYEIFDVPVEDRTVRVALLGVEIAAASNVDNADVIRGMIDRYRRAAFPFPGPPLVSQYYPRVPLGSVVWTVARPTASGASDEHGELLVPGGWSGLLPAQSVVIASARPLNEIWLRADVLMQNPTEAQKFSEKVATYLAIFKSLEISVDSGGPDKDVKAAFDSLDVRQNGNEATLTAKVPYAFFKKVLSSPPGEFGSEPQKPQEQPAPPPQPTPRQNNKHAKKH
jgi:hypothetical protein